MKTRTLITYLLAATLPVALLASTSDDRKIEDTARGSYDYRVVLGNAVAVHANDGVVTLTGAVPDRDARAIAEDTIENIPGVVSVDNQITIKSGVPEHSDAWIALKIRGELLVKAHVSATSTSVHVKDGVVTLRGTVQTPAQKELTEVYAKDIENVKSVNNELVVRAAGSGDTSVNEAMDDTSITTQVKYALLSHGSTSALSTKVLTDNAIVSITGVADSYAERDLVTRLAQDVRGVKKVVNTMTIKS